MNKENIEKKLQDLLTILEMNPEEYTEMKNRELGHEYAVDKTYVLASKIGVARGTLEELLKELRCES